MDGTLTLSGRVEDLAEVLVFARDRFPGAPIGAPAILEWQGWTLSRARAYLALLAPSGRTAIEQCVAGGGFAPDAALRTTIGSSLKGRTGAMTKLMNRMVSDGDVPATAPRPITAVTRKGSYKTGGFSMPGELVPIFAAALAS